MAALLHRILAPFDRDATPPSHHDTTLTWCLDAPPVIGLLVLVGVFFWPVLWGHAFLWNDFPERVYPTRVFASVELSEGRFPFWNPYLFGGIPFFAMIDNAVLYPLNWLLIPWVRENGLSYLLVEWLTLLHIAFSGAGMYFMGRRFGLQRAGAFTAGGIWMFSGPVVHHVFHGEMLHTLSWLPWILFFLAPALEGKETRHAILAGVMWGLAILAGHPQIFLYTGCVMGLYGLFCFVTAIRSSGFGRDTMRLPGLIILTFGIGVALGAVALIPAIELSQYSFRQSEWTEATAQAYSLDPRQLITLAMPDFFGAARDSGSDYWGPGAANFGHYWETYVYMGILPVFLALAGVLHYWRWQTLFLAVLAALCLGLSFGPAFPLSSIIAAVIPGFELFRAHARLSMIMAFAVAALAGFGVDALRGGNPADVRRVIKILLTALGALAGVELLLILVQPEVLLGWFAGGQAHINKARLAIMSHGVHALSLTIVSGAVLAIWYTGKIAGQYCTAVAIAVVLIDLSIAGMDFNASTAGIETYYPHEPVVAGLQEQQRYDGARVSLRSGGFGIIRRNGGTIFRIETLEGVISALRLADTMPPAPWDRMIDLMNVSLHTKLLDNGTARLEANPDPLPRAFVVHDYVVAQDREVVRHRLSDPGFDYRTTVTVDRLPPFSAVKDTLPMTEPVQTLRSGPNELHVLANLSRPGLIVLSEVYYPAWTAYVDGENTPVYRADGTLRAIAVEAGRHEVVLRYESASFFYGAVISMLTLAALACAWLIYRKRPGSPACEG